MVFTHYPTSQMKNNTIPEAYKKEIVDRAGKAIMANDVGALLSIIDEVYAVGYGAGYDDGIQDAPKSSSTHVYN